MDDVRFKAIENQMDALIRRHRDFLEERIDPDFGLLDELHRRGALSLEEISEIKDNYYLRERNSSLLRSILKNHQGDSLLWALQDAKQRHIANYLIAEYAPHIGEEWPLTSEEISILDTNRESLADLLDLSDLLGLLLSKNVINKRQMELASSKSTSHEKALTLLEILRRGSRNDYKWMIICLYKTNQIHISEILSKGGDCNVKTMKGYAIIGNNGSNLLENIERNNELNPSLSTLNCKTPRGNHLIQRKHRDRGPKTKRRKLADALTEQNAEPSTTTLYDLPLEVLDVILRKSYLHWILNSSTKQRDEEVIRCLTSVDVCFYERMAKHRFKKSIWRLLKDFYRKCKKISASIRNNRIYLLENIQPNDELFSLLLSLGCITEEQRQLIQRKRSERAKNDELLSQARRFNDKSFSNFVKCLRLSKQKTVAKIIENRGGVIKLEVQLCNHKTIENNRNIAALLSHQTEKRLNQLKEERIEILNSQLVGQTEIVWVWCRSQSALENIQRIYESNKLMDVLFENTQPSTSKRIFIDANQFKKTIVVYPISISFTGRIDIKRRGGYQVWGVTKLRNEIYVLCRPFSARFTVIYVCEDRNEFSRRKDIETKEVVDPVDIESSEKENCLYIADDDGLCIWKMTRETGDEYKIIKWLITDYKPRSLSVSCNGHLLTVCQLSSTLMIYGSDAELIRSFQLPIGATEPLHAVETSTGNFIVSHKWAMEEDQAEENEEGQSRSKSSGRRKQSRSSERKKAMKWILSEFIRDGQMVGNHFFPSNELFNYFVLDSDDRVFLNEEYKYRVILLDSDLKWNRILVPTEKEENKMIKELSRLCYDEENKQLICGVQLKGGGIAVNIYTFIENYTTKFSTDSGKDLFLPNK